jgi:hypothetical protein
MCDPLTLTVHGLRAAAARWVSAAWENAHRLIFQVRLVHILYRSLPAHTIPNQINHRRRPERSAFLGRRPEPSGSAVHFDRVAPGADTLIKYSRRGIDPPIGRK